MIIWGSKAREKKIDSGVFYCPGCKGDAEYSHFKVAKYFTLYFIPLFPTQTLGEYVRCEACQGEYNEQVLQLSREEIQAALSPWSCRSCENKNPAGETQCLACGAQK